MEILETRGDLRVCLESDEDMGNPRVEYDHVVHVVTVPSGYYNAVDPDGGPLAGAWQRLLDAYDWDKAVEIFERYARMRGVLTLYDTPQDGPNAVWYLTPEGIQEVGDPMAALEGEREEYRAWARGEVYWYAVQRRVTWHHAAHDDDNTMDTWEIIDSCGGMIGYTYAEQEAREALDAHVREADANHAAHVRSMDTT